MSRTVKNLVLAFTLLCAIVLVVFCIELVILNWDKGDGEEGPPVSDSSPSGDPGDADGQETPDEGQPGDANPDGDGDGDANGDGDEDAGGERQPPQGSRKHELMMIDDENTLILYVDEEKFELSTGETDWTFSFLGNGSASLEIASDFVSPEGVTALAEVILIEYLEGSDGEPKVGGERQIGESPLLGIYVSGEKGDETYEAWVHGPLSGGNSGPAVVFIINYENEEQKEALYAILDTFEMIPKEAE